MRQRALIIISIAAIGIVGLATFAIRDAAAEVQKISWGALKVKYWTAESDTTGGGTNVPTNVPTNTPPPK